MLVAPYSRGKNSEILQFKGKFTWCQLVNLNKYGKWSLNLYPDHEALEKIRELQAEGVKNVIKKDDDGYYLQISRPAQIEFVKGQAQSVTPPVVRDKDKNALPNNVEIGDGSDGLVAVEVYSYKLPNTEKRSKAMRLYGIEVHNLVPKNVPVSEPTLEPEPIW